jgi:hypothetical protein
MKNSSKLIKRKKRLSKEEKKAILSTIRYCFLTQDDLYNLPKDALFKAAKDFILEGLAIRLSNHESLKYDKPITV